LDDCFWPSGETFVPGLAELVGKIKTLTDAPIVLGGVGFSMFAERLVEYTGADFGIRGDGEKAIVSLHNELRSSKNHEKVPGLVWRQNRHIISNPPAWPEPFSIAARRDAIDNRTYFARAGQIGVETKRGCNRRCIYCADPIAKGTKIRLRNPVEIADEVEALVAQDVDVLHLCDSEFNVDGDHAYVVCEELIRRSLDNKMRWYTYMAVVPFDARLATIMRKAGCVGIDFTGDSGCPKMLKTYHQKHKREDLASAIQLCRENGITVMVDLLLGGPGETPKTLSQTIDFIKQIGPDCAGAPLGVKLCPGTKMADLVAAEGPLETNPAIRRKYAGPVDFFYPTFYISQALGERPAKLVQELIAGDQRFFGPMEEARDGATSTDHNYNDNTELVEAIKNGARGAFWDVLRKLRHDKKRNRMG
jgi:radical SAM superfamily enzyme YgiQ (UPF0313 family)